jgi:uncharacterized protein (DUF1330 family)
MRAQQTRDNGEDLMVAYVILIRESPPHDPAAMAEYGRKAAEGKPPATLKPLALYGAMEALEGRLPDGAVLLEFPTVQDARDWYYSPRYQAAAVHRKKGADYRAFIVQGL